MPVWRWHLLSFDLVKGAAQSLVEVLGHNAVGLCDREARIQCWNDRRLLEVLCLVTKLFDALRASVVYFVSLS